MWLSVLSTYCHIKNYVNVSVKLPVFISEHDYIANWTATAFVPAFIYLYRDTLCFCIIAAYVDAHHLHNQ